jgi:hypothetical protein
VSAPVPAAGVTPDETPAPVVAGAARRAPALTLARVHLRLGSLVLARTELEILDGQGALDTAGRVDLAEVRWRMGDLGEAGAAATAALEAGAQDPMALVVAAEAAAAIGRPNEARRLASLALERVGGPIDPFFAGMPRSGVWPADADEPPPTPGTLFHQEPPAVTLRAGDTDPSVAHARAAHREAAPDTDRGTPETLALWDADGDEAHVEVARDDLPDAHGELEAGRAALLAGDPDEASLRLALALRLAPALAPAILEATEGAATPGLSVIRGDAYRQVGLETAARRAYAAAAWSGARDRRRSAPGPRRGRRAGSRSTVSEAPPGTAPSPAAEPSTPAEPVLPANELDPVPDA